MCNLLVLLRYSPFNNAQGREALDLILALAAVDHNVSVLFSGDAVFQLLPTKDQPDFALKAYPRSFKLFELYDIDQVYVCEQSLRERGIKQNQLVTAARPVSANDITVLLAEQHQVISS
ncbi:sulfurtransferase complex subunit TusC [Rheinheimera baltica]|uniref:sulfurtransferase complex subunit TusC n=1 Tax=Rheinheimera baltica TaxID=67576 RepID=UPI00273FE79C|nr:sulfurtransferase complex subunit TusC [Rheinheimera baltica]MDP5144564.1 sulfurtransferase complex subunit TusC [Rheinheimera baltica]